MNSEKLETMFAQPDLETFKSEAARWQMEALLRLFRRLNKRAGEIKRDFIPGGREAFDFCLDKMNAVTELLGAKFKISASVGADGRSLFYDAETGNAVLLNGQIPANN